MAHYRGLVLPGAVPERFRPLIDATATLSARFERAGSSLYLVGGSVRDALLGPDATGAGGGEGDLDLTTDARPSEIERLLAGWADAIWDQGRRFGTVGARHQGRTYEITTHRAEVYRPDSRKPEVVFGDDIETDLAGATSPSTRWRCGSPT